MLLFFHCLIYDLLRYLCIYDWICLSRYIICFMTTWWGGRLCCPFFQQELESKPWKLAFKFLYFYEVSNLKLLVPSENIHLFQSPRMFIFDASAYLNIYLSHRNISVYLTNINVFQSPHLFRSVILSHYKSFHITLNTVMNSKLHTHVFSKSL